MFGLARTFRSLWGASRRLGRTLERFVFGGERRRAALMRALIAHDKSLLRRQWQLADEMPHYYDHRLGSLLFSAGRAPPFGMFRAFLSAQIMRPGDVVLDIGCGDGFFANRFFAPRVAHVDAIDIEPSAIEHARRHHAAPNIDYRLRDAVSDAFPRARYDVIVWDGALGHFPPDVTRHMLAKIRQALAEGGAFAGSESLGEEGHDHLQFFGSLDALRRLLSEEFDVVQLNQLDYELPGGFARREAYWRCALSSFDRLVSAAWR